MYRAPTAFEEKDYDDALDELEASEGDDDDVEASVPVPTVVIDGTDGEEEPVLPASTRSTSHDWTADGTTSAAPHPPTTPSAPLSSEDAMHVSPTTTDHPSARSEELDVLLRRVDLNSLDSPALPQATTNEHTPQLPHEHNPPSSTKESDADAPPTHPPELSHVMSNDGPVAKLVPDALIIGFQKLAALTPDHWLYWHQRFLEQQNATVHAGLTDRMVKAQQQLVGPLLEAKLSEIRLQGYRWCSENEAASKRRQGDEFLRACEVADSVLRQRLEAKRVKTTDKRAASTTPWVCMFTVWPIPETSDAARAFDARLTALAAASSGTIPGEYLRAYLEVPFRLTTAAPFVYHSLGTTVAIFCIAFAIVHQLDAELVARYARERRASSGPMLHEPTIEAPRHHSVSDAGFVTTKSPASKMSRSELLGSFGQSESQPLICKDINDFISLLRQAIERKYPALAESAYRSVLHNVAEDAVFSPLYGMLLARAASADVKGNQKLNACTHALVGVSMEQLNIPAKFHLSHVQAPYYQALQLMQLFGRVAAPRAKLEVVAAVLESISASVTIGFHYLGKKATLGADDLLPIFVWVIINSQSYDLLAQDLFIDLLSRSATLKGKSGYSFATLQVAERAIEAEAGRLFGDSFMAQFESTTT